jgi:DNA gyrase/topoisomerase IV subunit B
MTETFKILTDEDHILLRPSMYIGSVDETDTQGYFINLSNNVIKQAEYKTIKVIPGLLKIINEIIDNSVDEHIRTAHKYATKIDVSIKQNLDSFEVSVADNGRGIPIVKVKGANEYRPVLSWGCARSGTSFEEVRTTAGTNGLGSFATYVFSKVFRGETYDGTNGLVFEKAGKKVTVKPSSKHGTKVTFQPELDKFNNGSLCFDSHVEYIRQRLLNLSVCYPKINFTFNDEKLHIDDISLLASSIIEHNIVYRDKTTPAALIIGSTAEQQEFRFHSYVNGLHNPNGGTHVDFLAYEICAALLPLVKKKYKIDITPSHIKNNLFLGIFASDFINLKFDSQTKEKITNSKAEVSAYFKEYDYEAIAKKILAKEEIINPIVQSILYKKELAERLELARQQKKNKKVDVPTHIAATFPNPEERILFISEGLSACGPILSVRCNNKIGGYPLRGKIMNVNGEKAIDIIQNKELSELMTVCGLELNKPATNLNYGKFVFMVDPDIDGNSICTLLTNFFALWGDSLFKDKRIYRIAIPLFYATKKNTEPKYYYDYDTFYKDEKNLKGYEVTYFKGLGTMPTEVYDKCINKPKLIPITYDNTSKDYLEMAFGKDSAPRKKWLLNEC